MPDETALQPAVTNWILFQSALEHEPFDALMLTATCASFVMMVVLIIRLDHAMDIARLVLLGKLLSMFLDLLIRIKQEYDYRKNDEHIWNDCVTEGVRAGTFTQCAEAKTRLGVTIWTGLLGKFQLGVFPPEHGTHLLAAVTEPSFILVALALIWALPHLRNLAL